MTRFITPWAVTSRTGGASPSGPAPPATSVSTSSPLSRGTSSPRATPRERPVTSGMVATDSGNTRPREVTAARRECVVVATR